MTIKGILRKYGRPRRKAKALPVEDLERIIASLAQAGTFKALRDNAVLQLGFFGGFRRGELVGIDVDHVAWERSGIVITLPRSKTDQEGEGIVKAIPYGHGPLCPSTALRAWLGAAGIGAGPVFRSISKSGQLGDARLQASALNEILTGAARLAQLHYARELSAHSLSAPAPTRPSAWIRPRSGWRR